MNRTIVLKFKNNDKAIDKRFDVALKNANREARNRSYSQASDCCGKALKQEKKCSACGELSAYKTQRKLVKIGKQEHIVPSALLEQIQEQLEQQSDITIGAVADKLPDGAEDRFDSLVYAFPIEKKEAQYKELSAVLQGKVGIGTAVFNGNEFQILVTVGDDGVLRVRKLVEEGQRYDFDARDVQTALEKVELSPELVKVERTLLDKQKVSDYDVTAFKDRRAEYEEQVIEDVVINGKEFVMQPIATQQQQDALAEMKALLGE